MYAYKTVIKVKNTDNVTPELIAERQQKLDEYKAQNKTDGISEFNRETNVMTIKWTDLVSASEWITYATALSTANGIEIISSQVQTI